MPPDDQTVYPILGLAILARLVDMHLHTKGALIDLRGAELHQMMQQLVESGFGDTRLYRFQLAEDGLGVGVKVHGSGASHVCLLRVVAMWFHRHVEPALPAVT